MVEGTSMRNRLDGFNNLMMNLKYDNEAFPDEKQCMKLLAFLLNSFEYFMDSLLEGSTKIILEELKSA